VAVFEEAAIYSPLTTKNVKIRKNEFSDSFAKTFLIDAFAREKWTLCKSIIHFFLFFHQ